MDTWFFWFKLEITFMPCGVGVWHNMKLQLHCYFLFFLLHFMTITSALHCRLLVYGIYCSQVELAIRFLDQICKEKEDVRLKLEVGQPQAVTHFSRWCFCALCFLENNSKPMFCFCRNAQRGPTMGSLHWGICLSYPCRGSSSITCYFRFKTLNIYCLFGEKLVT